MEEKQVDYGVLLKVPKRERIGGKQFLFDRSVRNHLVSSKFFCFIPAGYFGKVYKIEKDGFTYAVKKLDKRRADDPEKLSRNLRKEADSWG